MSTPPQGFIDRVRGAFPSGGPGEGSSRSSVRFSSNISLAGRLVLVVLAATIASLVVVSTVSLLHGTALAERLLEGRMESLAALKAGEVEATIDRASSRVHSLAGSQMMRDGARSFAAAFAALASSADPSPRIETDVTRYYREEFGPSLQEATATAVSYRKLLPEGDAAILLQHAYIVDSPAGRGSESVIDDAGDGSEWSAVHNALHPRFLEIADQLGFGDLYIVEPLTATIVYSSRKNTDFATSLDRGPYSASSLAALVRLVRDDPSAGTRISDLSPYPPALGAPVGFMASPILDDGRLLGVLAARFPVDRINEIMTSAGDWESEGLGETGESYIVGSDRRMRSISRTFLEDPGTYYEAVTEAGSIGEADLESVRALGTTILFQDAAARDGLAAAADGELGVIESTNYLGRSVLTAYQPITVDQFEWFVAVEIEEAEVRQPLTEFRRAILIAASVFVLAITFLTVAWARRALEPVHAISERLRLAVRGEPGGKAEPLAQGPLELGELSANVDRMIEMAERRRAELQAASRERVDTLTRLLPPEIAERIESGDRVVVEHVHQATIVVVVLEGMGALIDTADVAATRSGLDAAINLLDDLAARHGLERVKIIGDLYVAGCGLNHVYLDHAPRAVAFAHAAESAMRDLSGALAHALRPAIGIDSGPVAVGLGGSSQLVYDVWGESVNVAYRLAEFAGPDEILVSDRTKATLPSEIALERIDTGGEPTWRVGGISIGQEARS